MSLQPAKDDDQPWFIRSHRPERWAVIQETGVDPDTGQAYEGPAGARYLPDGVVVQREEQPVSLLSSALSKIGISKDVQRAATNFLVPSPVQALTKTLAPLFGGGGGASTGGVAAPQYAGFGLPGGAVGGAIGTAIGTAASGLINRYAPGGTTASGCGCNGSKGRDPCTHQSLASQRAPLATFFGGCCPPGRTLRRVAGGRDICARTARMNPFNPRALARADRRVTTFARRAAPILKDLGFDVSRHRKPKGIKLGKGRKRGR